MKGEIAPRDVAALEQEIVELLFEQEETINQYYVGGRLNHYSVEEMLSLFGRGPKNVGNRFEGLDSGYIFTLNQDLLVERVTVNGHMFDQPITPAWHLQRISNA